MPTISEIPNIASHSDYESYDSQSSQESKSPADTHSQIPSDTPNEENTINID